MARPSSLQHGTMQNRKPSSFRSILWVVLPIVTAGFCAWYTQVLQQPNASLNDIISLVSSNVRTFLSMSTSIPVQVNVSGIKNDSIIFNVVDLPGKGKGMIAARDIKQGELILSETPVIIVPAEEITQEHIDNFYNSSTREEAQSLLDLSWSKMKTDKYVNTDPSSQTRDNRYYLSEAIIQNNGVALRRGKGHFLGVFPRMARLNHACASAHNCAYHYRENDNELKVYALKDIKQGEELLIAYIETRRPRKERIEYLQKSYGFTCTCPVCSLKEEQVVENDEMLAQFTTLYTEFNEVYYNTIDGVQAMEIMYKLWSLTLKTDYIQERGRWAQEASYVSTLYGDEEATRQWIELAIKWTSIEYGADSERVENLRFTLDNLKEHPELGKRGSTVVGGPDASW